MDGKPLKIAKDERGLVVFRPVAGGPTCSGLIASSGTFSMATGSSTALSPGDYLVSVRVVRLGPPARPGEAPSGVPLTPAVYSDPLTSGLVFSVESGKNTIDIELSSAAGPAELPQQFASDEDPREDSTEAEADAEPAEEGEVNSDSQTSAAEAETESGAATNQDDAGEAKDDENANTEEPARPQDDA